MVDTNTQTADTATAVSAKNQKPHAPISPENAQTQLQELATFFSDDWNEEKNTFFQALMRAFGTDFVPINYNNDSDAYIDNLEKVSETLKPLRAEGEHVIFQSENGELAVNQNEVLFTPTDNTKPLGANDAFNMAFLASRDIDMVENGVDLNGTAYEQTMLQLAVMELNALRGDPRMPISNQMDMMALDPQAQQDYFTARPDALALIQADLKNTPPANTASAGFTASAAKAATDDGTTLDDTAPVLTDADFDAMQAELDAALQAAGLDATIETSDPGDLDIPDWMSADGSIIDELNDETIEIETGTLDLGEPIAPEIEKLLHDDFAALDEPAYLRNQKAEFIGAVYNNLDALTSNPDTPEVLEISGNDHYAQSVHQIALDMINSAPIDERVFSLAEPLSYEELDAKAVKDVNNAITAGKFNPFESFEPELDGFNDDGLNIPEFLQTEAVAERSGDNHTSEANDFHKAGGLDSGFTYRNGSPIPLDIDLDVTDSKNTAGATNGSSSKPSGRAPS